VRERAAALAAEGKEVKFLCVGRKGFDQLKRQFERQIVELIELRGVRQLGYEHAERVGTKVIELFQQGAFDVATLFFSRFKSVMVQTPTALQVIPPLLPEKRAEITYEYEPDELEILGELLPRNISVQVFRALLENAASEQGARMTAMDSATRNAGEMIRRRTLQYNRTRQAMITKELIEIISGAEAL
jgi:F-type H+-transporting ATPase subunit gamma